MRSLFRRIVTVAIALVLFPGAADIRDHLEPEESIYKQVDPIGDDYARIIVSVLKEGFADGVRFRMLAVPSFRNEYIVGLREVERSRYELLYLEPHVHLWHYQSLRMMREGQVKRLTEDGRTERDDVGIRQLEAMLPADPKGVKVRRCVMPIGSAAAKRILEVGKLLLLDTRFFAENEHVSGFDGETFHFWYGHFNLQSGRIWSPPKHSKPGRMIKIMDTLRNSCLKADRRLEAEALREIDALIRDFNSR